MGSSQTEEMPYAKTDNEMIRRKIHENKLSQDFLNKIRTCFLSNDKNKDTIIIHTVYKALKQGEEDEDRNGI